MQLIASPTAEPVDVDEAKAAARISDTVAFDAMLPVLIAAARQLAEHITGRKLMEQTWRSEFADWPDASNVLPLHQPTDAAVSYWTGSAWAALSSAAYTFAAVGNGTALAPLAGTSWPTLGERPVGARVQIDITAGQTDASAVPECVRLYIKAMVAHWIDNPSASAGTNLQEAPFLRLLLDPAKLY